MKTHRISFREQDRATFESIRAGLKPYETRASSGIYRQIITGDTIAFECGPDSFHMRVTSVQSFDTLDDMFHAIPYRTVIPEAASLQAAKDTYQHFPDYPQKLARYGVVAIGLGPLE